MQCQFKTTKLLQFFVEPLLHKAFFTPAHHDYDKDWFTSTYLQAVYSLISKLDYYAMNAKYKISPVQRTLST